MPKEKWMDVVVCNCYKVLATDKTDAIKKTQAGQLNRKNSDSCVFSGTYYDVMVAIDEPKDIEFDVNQDDKGENNDDTDAGSGWYQGSGKRGKEQDYINFDRSDDIQG